MAGELKAMLPEEFVTKLGDDVGGQNPSFDCSTFKQRVFGDGWDDLELKDRIRRVASALAAGFSLDYPSSVAILTKVGANYSGLPALVFPEFVEQNGLDDWDTSMNALAAFTSLCSSEFSVRPFIRLDEKLMLDQMMEWAQNEDHHIRRLASEGCRPRLPWASPLRRFISDPAPIIPILNMLKDDPEEYVRRSVANNLNDISKDHPDLALELGGQWLNESSDNQWEWVVKHGLRTLLKKGDTQALVLFGYGNPIDIEVNELVIENGTVTIGESAIISFEVRNTGTGKVKARLEFAIEYLKANGTHSRKIFQAGERDLNPGSHMMTKRHSFKQMTTRKHYSGTHKLLALVNGQEKARIEFELID